MLSDKKIDAILARKTGDDTEPPRTGMADIYERLEEIGLDRRFVRHLVMWDDWEDALADVPATRAMVEAHLSTALGVNLSSLRGGRRLRVNSSAAALWRKRCSESARFVEIWKELEAWRNGDDIVLTP